MTPEAQLRAYVARFAPKDQKLIRAVRSALRKRFPTANELVYDYGHSLVIGYSPSDKGIESIVSFAARESGVALYFNRGPELPDPKGLLEGSGRQTRFIAVESASRLAQPAVKALINAAIELSAVSLPAKGKGSVIIKSGAATKRPRRKGPAVKRVSRKK